MCAGKSFSLDFSADLGFAKGEAQFLLDGDERFTDLFDTPEADIEKGKLREIKQARKDGMERLKEKNNADFYAVVVFADDKERREFFKKSISRRLKFILPPIRFID